MFTCILLDSNWNILLGAVFLGDERFKVSEMQCWCCHPHKKPGCSSLIFYVVLYSVKNVKCRILQNLTCLKMIVVSEH